VTPGAPGPPVPINVTALTAPIPGVSSNQAVMSWAMPPERCAQLITRELWSRDCGTCVVTRPIFEGLLVCLNYAVLSTLSS
jgi:hypothetical protein